MAHSLRLALPRITAPAYRVGVGVGVGVWVRSRSRARSRARARVRISSSSCACSPCIPLRDDCSRLASAYLVRVGVGVGVRVRVEGLGLGLGLGLRLGLGLGFDLGEDLEHATRTHGVAEKAQQHVPAAAAVHECLGLVDIL